MAGNRMTYRHPKIGIPVTGDKVINKPHICEWCKWGNNIKPDLLEMRCDNLKILGFISPYDGFYPNKDFGCIFWENKE